MKIHCECGCAFEDHVEIGFTDGKAPIFYCRNCVYKPPLWCADYKPIDNLKYLEELYVQKEKP